jgi:GNAT superfamily N-acetyltransferase
MSAPPDSSRPELVPYERKYQQGFAELTTSVHAEFGFAYDPALDKDLAQPDAVYRDAWVIVEDGRVVGSVALLHWTDREAVLKRMYVAPHLRGRGFGRQLFDAIIERARSAGYARLSLDTNTRQLAAQRAYSAAGFTLTGRDGDTLYYALSLR